jgi:phospholipase/carboxylesterase
VGVSHHHPLDLALPVEQHADLSVGLQRELGEVPGQLGADDLVRRDPTAVGVAKLVQLTGLEAEGVPVQVFQMRSPGQPVAAASEDLAIFGPFRSWMRRRERRQARREPRDPAVGAVVDCALVRRVSLVLLLAGCTSALPKNVRLDPAPPPETARLHARPDPEFRPGQPGLWPIGLGSQRDGLLYVPKAALTRRVPLLVMLHGSGSSPGHIWTTVQSDAEERDVAVLMPASRQSSWDFTQGDFGADLAFIDAALASTFRRVPVDAAHVALGGFSAGATMALSLGPSNGDLFGVVFGFSPPAMFVYGRVGHPRFMVAHGTADTVVPIGLSSRQIVPALRAAGDWVVYREFPGGEHEVFADAVHEAFSLLVSD